MRKRSNVPEVTCYDVIPNLSMTVLCVCLSTLGHLSIILISWSVPEISTWPVRNGEHQESIWCVVCMNLSSIVRGIVLILTSFSTQPLSLWWTRITVGWWLSCILSHSDKATNPDHSEPDWETILEIVEEVKTKGVTWVTIFVESMFHQTVCGWGNVNPRPLSSKGGGQEMRKVVEILVRVYPFRLTNVHALSCLTLTSSYPSS